MSEDMNIHDGMNIHEGVYEYSRGRMNIREEEY